MICHVCSTEITPKTLLVHKSKGWDIVRCPECQISFVHPQPDEKTIIEYYNGMYSNLTAKYNEKQMELARQSMQGYVSELKKLGVKNGASFLDLGGGLGYHTKAAEESGLVATLLDPDPDSIRFAKDELKLNNVVEMLNEDFFKSTNEKYDVVFVRHVIEHVVDPIPFMKGISGLLKEGGVMVIETDNNAGIELMFRPLIAKFYLKLYKKSYENISIFKLISKRPFALDPPRHLFAFRMANLSMLADKSGIKPVKKIHYRLGHPTYWPNLPLTPFKDYLKAIFTFKVKKVIFDTVDYIMYPFRLILQSLGMSSGLCIYAVKHSKS